MLNKMSIKFIKMILIILVVSIIGGLLLYRMIRVDKKIEKLRESAQTLTVEESTMFQTYFGIEKPESLLILNCAYRNQDNETFYAVKAVVSNHDFKAIINQIKKIEGAEIYEHKFSRRSVLDEFSDELLWWDIDSGRMIKSYHIVLNSHKGGSVALTVTKNDGIYYVYIWYTDPAWVSK